MFHFRHVPPFICIYLLLAFASCASRAFASFSSSLLSFAMHCFLVSATERSMTQHGSCTGSQVSVAAGRTQCEVISRSLRGVAQQSLGSEQVSIDLTFRNRAFGPQKDLSKTFCSTDQLRFRNRPWTLQIGLPCRKFQIHKMSQTFLISISVSSYRFYSASTCLDLLFATAAL